MKLQMRMMHVSFIDGFKLKIKCISDILLYSKISLTTMQYIS